MSDKYMKNLTFANIAKACEGRYIGDETLLDTTITGAAIDSRQVKEGYLFIPIKGERVDGHKFIPTVFEQGAAIVLSEHELTDPAGPYVIVESTTDAMKKLAAFYRKSLDIKVVGITGSVGKTSTKEMISSVLEQKYSVHKTAGNFNNEIGLPLTIFGIRENHQVAVLEMGISDFGEMHRLSTMSCPDVMVITNIGYCHLEFLGNRDGVLKAKTECFEHMMPDAVAVLNADDDKLATVQTVNGKPAIYYGKESASDVHKSVYIKPPLGVLNAVLAQPVALAFGFHPFGDGGQIERFGHFNNVRRQRPVLEGIDKRFIDFQRVDVQFLQIAQAGVAGAKVINRDPMPGLTVEGCPFSVRKGSFNKL